ncbi:MAG: molybdopterin-guanine dinucleotide biosynthesis protein B [Chloroflexi bacterium]|nr:molybdopterin-guanine dinucleotide biosynthesis protein B [Chloroflexota bacterium]
MRQVVGIIGYKDSGKTTLTRRLAHELTGRGYKVAVVKHTHHSLDAPGKDTAILGQVVEQVAIISAQESALFWQRPLSLKEILPHLEGDIILVEGFKKEKTHPKIACLRGKPDDEDLFNDLTICAVGLSDWMRNADVPLFDHDDIVQIANLVERKICNWNSRY